MLHSGTSGNVNSITFVSAFLKTPNPKRSADTYLSLFDEMAATDLPFVVFTDTEFTSRPNVTICPQTLKRTWAGCSTKGYSLPEKSNPTDTWEYLCVQNSKLEFLHKASLQSEASHFCWLDFGLLHIAKDKDRFRAKLKEIAGHGWPADIAMTPGCWSQGNYDGDSICWRFLGGFMLLGRERIAPLWRAHRKAILANAPKLSWEVNYWELMEKNGCELGWYFANHNDTILPSIHNSVVLVMIVKNEAKIIERCLRAAKPAITHWSIVDTGSTDGTQDIIRREMADLPGTLHERPWVNFGHNRTESFQLASEWIKSQGVKAEHCWCLLLDADHQLSFSLSRKETFYRDALTESAYCIPQKNAAVTYYNPRLIRADQPAVCRGVTHEYWDVSRAPEPLQTLSIIDHEDGGSKGDKFSRDLELLTKGLANDEEKGLWDRYRFYLAQTYDSLGDVENAEKNYAIRADMGGFEEERWMARYRQGKMLLRLGRESEGEAVLAKAWQERPQRAEPLYQLTHHHRNKGRNHLAEMYAKRAKEIPLPTSDILFVEHDVYETGIDEELSIVSYYVDGKHEQGLAASEKLLTTHRASSARANICWYAKPLPRTGQGTFDVPRELRTFEGVEYFCSNPSVCGNVQTVRLVNYEHANGRCFIGRPHPYIIRSQCAIRRGGEDWKILRNPLHTSEWNQQVSIFGLEDIRLSEYQGRIVFTASSCQAPDAGGRPQVLFGSLSEDLSEVDFLTPIRYSGNQPVEKNWALCPRGDELWCIYSYDPLVVLRINPITGEAEEIRREPVRSYTGRFRGSTRVIDTPFGLLSIVHDVSNLAERNVYTHRFMNNLVRESRPFVFDHHGVEYAAGLSLEGDCVRISYGFEEKEARWITCKMEEVWAMLDI